MLDDTVLASIFPCASNVVGFLAYFLTPFVICLDANNVRTPAHANVRCSYICVGEDYERGEKVGAEQGGPIGRGERAYTCRGDQSDKGRGHIPARGTNQTRGEGIYPQGGPIGRGERAHTRKGDQSDEGRGNITSR